MREQLTEILHKVQESPLIDAGELLEAYRLVIMSIHDGLNIKRAGVWCLSDDHSGINCRLLIDTHHNSEIEELTIYAQDYPKYFKALKSERTILANDAHTDPATSEFSEGYLTPLFITSMLDVPIRHKGEMIGIICCEHIGEQRNWTSEEAQFVASMADLIGRAKNASAFKESEVKLIEVNTELETKVKERTAQLLESEKMAALGNLVAGIAHEVNTPLGISITATSTIADTIRGLEKAMNEGRLTEDVFKEFLRHSQEVLFLLNNNLTRAADLVQNFKKTAVDQSDQSIHIYDIDESLNHLILSLKPELAKVGVNVALNIEEKLSIYSYPSAWLQIISNLVLNSCKHAFKGIDVRNIVINFTVVENQIVVHYEDNGNGIEADKVAKIILPFYTTARGNGGSGLGMSIVYNLVTEQLKGKMVIESDTGKGMNIDITCPLMTHNNSD